MDVPKQTNKEKERREGKIMNVKLKTYCISCLFLKHAFRNLARMFFKNCEFVLANYKSYGCSRTREGKVTNVKLTQRFCISCLSLKHAFSRNLATMFFENWEFVLANYISYGRSQGCFSKNGNWSLQLYISQSLKASHLS
jgi:hypothetical protein